METAAVAVWLPEWILCERVAVVCEWILCECILCECVAVVCDWILCECVAVVCEWILCECILCECVAVVCEWILCECVAVVCEWILCECCSGVRVNSLWVCCSGVWVNSLWVCCSGVWVNSLWVCCSGVWVNSLWVCCSGVWKAVSVSLSKLIVSEFSEGVVLVSSDRMGTVKMRWTLTGSSPSKTPARRFSWTVTWVPSVCCAVGPGVLPWCLCFWLGLNLSVCAVSPWSYPPSSLESLGVLGCCVMLLVVLWKVCAEFVAWFAGWILWACLSEWFFSFCLFLFLFCLLGKCDFSMHGSLVF